MQRSRVIWFLTRVVSRKLRNDQRITREFWQDTRFEFILSDYVVEEISVGNREQAENRQLVVEGLNVVVATSPELDFARLFGC